MEVLMGKKQIKIKKYPIPGWVLVLVTALFGELMLHFWTTEKIMASRVLTVLLFAGAYGGLIGFLVSLIPPKAQKWVSVTVSVLQVALIMTWYFVNDCFKVFMPLGTIFAGAENVAAGFMDTVWSLIAFNWWRILVLLLPAIFYGVFAQCKAISWKGRGVLGGSAALLFALAFGAVFGISGDQDLLRQAYNFDHAVHAFGLDLGLTLDLFQLGGGEAAPEFVEVDVPEETEASELPAVAVEETEVEETKPDYQPQVLDLDFAALAESQVPQAIRNLHNYVASQKPAMENEYTGLFKGKNLIFISAEAFSKEVIDKDLTPALYRMANEGIQFLDYYQPNWGGGTSGGEFANLMGLPANGGSMYSVLSQDMIMTMGYQLDKLGYRSGAYHNNSANFYDRNKTHVRLGYDEYVAMGNGMEEGVTEVWPQSDLEMFRFIMPKYLNGDKTPFNLYFMSVSGHSIYAQAGNAMSKKNYDAVKDLDCGEEIKCYLAANLELEYAMEYLLEELENAGIADDTVVVIAADHFPYGLEKSAAWGTGEDHLEELYGFPSDSCFARDHNRLIIWSGCLEGMDIKVEEPTSSIDILPTLSNLFDVDYDSRLLVGRDVFSDTEPLVLWNTYCWRTEKGNYDPMNRVFTPNEGQEADQAYIDRITAIVKNKLSYTKSVLNNQYFNYIRDALADQ